MTIVFRRTALAIGALALAAFLIWSSVPALLARTPQLAQRYAPHDPESLYRLATLDYARRAGALPLATIDRVLRAAPATPLSGHPFVFAALRAARDGRPESARALLEEARRRDPRHRLARALLLERYIRDGQVAEASAEIAALHRLVPDARTTLVDALTTLALDPATSATVGRVLRDDDLFEPLLADLVAKGADLDAVLSLARLRRGVREPAWQNALLDRLVAEGRFETARSIWAEFGAVDAQAARAPVFNTSFARVATGAPFNWRLTAGDIGAAELTRGRRLAVEFYGRRSGALATQLMTLAPGAWRLAVGAEGGQSDAGDRIIWAVRCAEAGKPPQGGRDLMMLPVPKLPKGRGRLGRPFTVPATGCGAQWLSVEGAASEFPVRTAVEFQDLRIARARSDDEG